MSNGLFFDKHLKLIELSQQSVAFTEMDLTHLLKVNYANHKMTSFLLSKWPQGQSATVCHVRNLISSNLSILQHLLQDKYDPQFGAAVYTAPMVDVRELRAAAVVNETPAPAVRVAYTTKEDYKRTAKALGLMDDFRVSASQLPTQYLLIYLLSMRHRTICIV